jgi:hypothetical protein
MTVSQLVRLLGRRWYVVLVGLAVAACSFLLMQRDEGLYTQHATMAFVAPGDAAVGVSNDALTESVVDFAASIERIMNDGKPVERLASAAATLNGAGVTEGYVVQLPNFGGQWQTSFSRPVLEVQVVGPSPAWVTDTMNRLQAQIVSTTAKQQASVPQSERISVAGAPASVQHVWRSTSTTLRAFVALGVLGLGVSIAAAITLDRLLAARAKRRAPTTSHLLPGTRVRIHTTWKPVLPMNRPHGESAP